MLNTFFASVINRKSGYPQGNQPLELLIREGEQNGLPAIQEELVSGLLILDTQKTLKSVRSDRIHLRPLREL